MRVNHWPLLWQACYFTVAKSVSSLMKEHQQEDICQMTSCLSSTKGRLICASTQTTPPQGLRLGPPEKEGTTGNEVAGWHHRLYGHEFEQAPGDGEGQGGPACCSPRGHSESDTTEQLNNNHLPYQA